MLWIWVALIVIGQALVIWTNLTLPGAIRMQPGRVPAVRLTHGAFRWLRHPMYVGNVLFVVGLAGLAAGFWNALAVGTVAELLMREWAGREDGK